MPEEFADLVVFLASYYIHTKMEIPDYTTTDGVPEVNPSLREVCPPA